MISGVKRREVARELRKLATPGCIRYAEEFYEELREIVALDLDGSFEGVANSLADLIEPHRKTCSLHRVKPFSPYATCTRCGAFINTFNGASNATERIDIKYCPCCGAEVIDEDGAY